MDTLRVSQFVILSPSAIFITFSFNVRVCENRKCRWIFAFDHYDIPDTLVFLLVPALLAARGFATRISRLRTAFTFACSRLCSHGLKSESETAQRGDVAALARSHISGSLSSRSAMEKTTGTPPPPKKK